MGSYLLRRLMITVVLVFGVITIVFSLLRLLPGDPATLILGGSANPQAIEAFRAEMGLNLPFHVQYAHWLKGLVRFDLGKSVRTRYPVARYISGALPRTGELILAAVILAVLVGVPLGVLAALKRETIIDSGITLAAVIGLSSPVFVLGTVLILVFALNLRWLPSGNFVPLIEQPLEHLRRLILPSLSLALPLVGVTVRMTRSSLLDVLDQDYVTTARGKGLRERTTLVKHALRTSLIPVITMLGLQIGSLLGGTVIAESIFNWPGLSTLLVDASYGRDYPIVQGVILVIALLFILVNILVDLTVALLDPRIVYQ